MASLSAPEEVSIHRPIVIASIRLHECNSLTFCAFSSYTCTVLWLAIAQIPLAQQDTSCPVVSKRNVSRYSNMADEKSMIIACIRIFLLWAYTSVRQKSENTTKRKQTLTMSRVFVHNKSSLPFIS